MNATECAEFERQRTNVAHIFYPFCWGPNYIGISKNKEEQQVKAYYR